MKVKSQQSYWISQIYNNFLCIIHNPPTALNYHEKPDLKLVLFKIQDLEILTISIGGCVSQSSSMIGRSSAVSANHSISSSAKALSGQGKGKEGREGGAGK